MTRVSALGGGPAASVVVSGRLERRQSIHLHHASRRGGSEASPGRRRDLRDDTQGVRPVRGTPDSAIRHLPGGSVRHRIDQVSAGQRRFAVDPGPALRFPAMCIKRI